MKIIEKAFLFQMSQGPKQGDSMTGEPPVHYPLDTHQYVLWNKPGRAHSI